MSANAFFKKVLFLFVHSGHKLKDYLLVTVNLLQNSLFHSTLIHEAEHKIFSLIDFTAELFFLFNVFKFPIELSVQTISLERILIFCLKLFINI
jgi:hypothetical protein